MAQGVLLRAPQQWRGRCAQCGWRKAGAQQFSWCGTSRVRRMLLLGSSVRVTQDGKVLVGGLVGVQLWDTW